MKITINPSSVSFLEHEKILREFYHTQSDQGARFWKKDLSYQFGDTVICFDFDVIQRERKAGKVGVRYEFISTKSIGKGAFGEVFEIAGTLILEPGIRYKSANPDKTRVVKIQQHDKTHSIQAAYDEYEKSREHLSAKKPVICGNTSYSVMRKFHGKELFEILNEKLAHEQRLDLSIALLKALKEQITDKGLIHRDIKGENILVDLDTMQIKIIDFGFCTSADEFRGGIIGTAAYAAPEVFNQSEQTVKMDVFSIARVLCLLWYLDADDDYELNRSEYQERYQNPKYKIHLNRLFSSLKVPPKEKQPIKDALQSMLIMDVSKRFSIEQAIESFEQIKILSTMPVVAAAAEVVTPGTSSIENIRFFRKASSSRESFHSCSEEMHPAASSRIL